MGLLNSFFVGSSPYEGPHILIISLWVITTTLLILFTCLFAKTEKSKVIVIKVTAAVLLLATILSRFIYNEWKLSFIDFLPSSFCSTMGFITPLFVFFCKKDSKNLYYALFAGFMGGLITLFSGDDIGQERVQNTIISYFYHCLMIALAMLCVAVKYSKPTLDKVPRIFIGFSIMVVYGVFSNQVFDYSNNMFLNSPLIEGTPLTWWLTGILMMVIAIIISLIYEAITLKWYDQSLYKCYCFCAKYLKSLKTKALNIINKKQNLDAQASSQPQEFLQEEQTKSQDLTIQDEQTKPQETSAQEKQSESQKTNKKRKKN